MKIGNKTISQRTAAWFSRPVRWFKKPLGKLAKPLAKIDGIEKPAVYLGIAFVLWRLWREQRTNPGALEGRQDSGARRSGRRRRPSFRLLVQERLNRAAFDRADDQNPQANA